MPRQPEVVGIPGIIHSTFLRFADRLTDPAGFKADFDRVAAEGWGGEPLELTLTEVCFTIEDLLTCRTCTAMRARRCSRGTRWASPEGGALGGGGGT